MFQQANCLVGGQYLASSGQIVFTVARPQELNSKPFDIMTGQIQSGSQPHLSFASCIYLECASSSQNVHWLSNVGHAK